MLKRLIYLTLALSALMPVGLFGQDDEQPKPQPPTLNYITVEPATGTVTAYWTPPRPNPLFPDPIGFIIYKKVYDEVGNSFFIEYNRVAPAVTSFIDAEATPEVNPVSYRVASEGTTEPSALTPEHATIFLTARYDSCARKLNVSWTHYVGWGNNIEEYKVFVKDNKNPNSFEKRNDKKIEGSFNTASLPIDSNQMVYLYVEAKKKDEELYTKSNLFAISTRVSRAPAFMYIDSIISLDKNTELRLDIDATTQYRSFSITRWEQVDSVRSIFSAKTLLKFEDPTLKLFTDTTDSWAARSRKFFYKINAFDGCKRLQRVSNLSNSMILRLHTRGLDVNLSWEKFYSRDKNPVNYKIYRIAHNPSPMQPELIFDRTNPSDTTFVDDLSPYTGQGFQSNFCYYIEASETIPVEGKSRLSRSRTVCTEVAPEIAMPNAIDPLSNFVYNSKARNLFVPTISFEANYKLFIYNRWGGVVFQGENQGWNGRLPDGGLAKEGTYVYRLEVHPESKRLMVKRGTVTVIYGPQQ